MLDGSTDMRRARNILGDHMAMMGDVPSNMLAFGTDTQVYDYVTSLIDDCGSKTGLIISSGCDSPMNAKPENVNAMIRLQWIILVETDAVCQTAEWRLL